jgi:DNA repair photolyase
MNYYALRSEVARMIPRTPSLFPYQKQPPKPIQEKGRKSGYSEFHLLEQQWIKQERLLNTQELNSFVEVSCRAAACPMPLNIDVWDGLLCPYGCKYCFANAFRASLYTAFFDNAKTMGLRHCDPDKYKKEMDVLLKDRAKNPHDVSGEVKKALALEIPLRFGIRFEDFLDEEAEKGVSLELLNYLADEAYPVMINTKSDLVGRDDYVEALSRNKGRSAVHITLISSNQDILTKLEPGAPTYKQRLKAMKNLTSAGVRVVARIEPFLPFINDESIYVQKYIEDVWKAGVRNITFDTYSYTAKNPGIKQSFTNVGMDYDRIFLAGCDSQALGSLLLGSFMDLFRESGFKCSTFDMGNVPDNSQDICCEVGDWFEGGYNYGSTVYAARYVKERGDLATSWGDFEEWVNENGGFLSDVLKKEVKYLWNCQGKDAYSHSWSRGLVAVGNDKDGLIWKFEDSVDFREDTFNNLRGNNE